MAYEMVTGVRPFVGPNLSNVIYQILNQDPVAAAPAQRRLPRAPREGDPQGARQGPRRPLRRASASSPPTLKEVLAALPRRGTPRAAARPRPPMVREELARMRPAAPDQLTAATAARRRGPSIRSRPSPGPRPSGDRRAVPRIVVAVRRRGGRGRGMVVPRRPRSAAAAGDEARPAAAPAAVPPPARDAAADAGPHRPSADAGRRRGRALRRSPGRGRDRRHRRSAGCSRTGPSGARPAHLPPERSPATARRPARSR